MISNLSERQRRSYLRKLEKGGSEAVKDIELENVDSEDEFGFSDDDDDQNCASSGEVVDENTDEDLSESCDESSVVEE